MLGPVNEGFRVADDDMDPTEDLMGLRIASERDLVVGVPLPFGTGVNSRSITLSHPEIRDAPSQHRFDSPFGQIRYRVQEDVSRVPLGRQTHRP